MASSVRCSGKSERLWTLKFLEGEGDGKAPGTTKGCGEAENIWKLMEKGKRSLCLEPLEREHVGGGG